MNRTFQTQGFSLIEVVMAISILGLVVVFTGYTISLFLAARAELVHDTKALYLAEEGYELVRALRDDDWNVLEALPTDVHHSLNVSSTSISVGGSPEVIDGVFTRSFVLRALYRDSDDDITSSTTPGADLDEEARWLRMYVSGPSGTTTLDAVVTNLYAI